FSILGSTGFSQITTQIPNVSPVTGGVAGYRQARCSFCTQTVAIKTVGVMVLNHYLLQRAQLHRGRCLSELGKQCGVAFARGKNKTPGVDLQLLSGLFSNKADAAIRTGLPAVVRRELKYLLRAVMREIGNQAGDVEHNILKTIEAAAEMGSAQQGRAFIFGHRIYTPTGRFAGE